MYTSHNTLKISHLRKHTAEVIDEIAVGKEPVFVFSHSEPKVVMMSWSAFEKFKKGEEKDDKISGLDFFIDPPEDMLVKKKGIDAVKLVRSLRS